ncbi:hypothetical protein SMGD1_1965 [Sulfurimonas gotlandica GD1]|uniref:Spore protein YkvP/CgeB glycosyl transferase-like domain-containing protein n=1 Tax=Sulfurimonas gotlandica (strain DSM 19862 / JCM 16533 / GD1) TaxID=929558 RepID=H1FWI5_SULGG|nr:glycosyltransferase [Sulfurimonas gotlandica]EHP30488.1 hypothetical protein SMGD1_1965 [Sulfurimonas gotlandica GD1]
MKILYINTPTADYVQDLTYTGLVKKFGLNNVIDYRWNKKYHVPYKKYPKNIGYVEGSLFSSIFRSFNFSEIDYVFIGACKVEAFETYIEIAHKIPSHVPVIFIDGGDGNKVGIDLVAYKRPDLYEKALSVRPFDFTFKREYLIDGVYDSNVAPLPMSFNFDRLPSLPTDHKYDVSFWAVESHTLRTQALDMLENMYDCKENGTTRNQKFSKYKRKGSFYLQELADCKIIINIRGGGWDTMRYWETPAVGAFMLSQKPQIVIPDNFEHEKDVVFFKDDLSDLQDLCDFYLKNDAKREEIAKSGLQKMKDFHTDEKRIDYIFKTINKEMK